MPFEYNSLTFRWNADHRTMAEDFIVVARGDGEDVRQGAIDIYGNIIVPFEYDSIGTFHQGLVAVTRGGMVGFIDEFGELVIPLSYGTLGARAGGDEWSGTWTTSRSGGFSNGLAVISETNWVDNHWGGDEPFSYRRNRFGLIDKTGNVILPFEYDFIFPFSEGLASVGMFVESYFNNWNYWAYRYAFGVIDMYGNLAIPLEYNWIEPFSEGVAVARIGRQSGLIDTAGNVIIPFEYTSISRVANFDGWGWEISGREPGVLRVTRDGKSGLLDIFGNVIIPVEYDLLQWEHENRLFHARNDQKLGLIDIDGTIIIPVEYDSIRPLENGSWVAVRDDEAVVFNKDGTILVPCTHEHYNLRYSGRRAFFEIDFIEIDGSVYHTIPRPEAVDIMRNESVFWIQENGLFGIVELIDQPLPYIETLATTGYYYETTDINDTESTIGEDNGSNVGVIVLVATGGTMLAVSTFFGVRALYKKHYKAKGR